LDEQSCEIENNFFAFYLSRRLILKGITFIKQGFLKGIKG
jgi:hypothetical protein